MTRQLFTQGGDLRRRNRAGFISPLLPNVSQHVGDLSVGERFIPRLHHGCPKLHPLDRDRTLQSFEHNHPGPSRAAIDDFRTGKWRVTLARSALSTRLVADRAVRGENLFAAIGLRKLLRLFAW